jgi:hypothetical protein
LASESNGSSFALPSPNLASSLRAVYAHLATTSQPRAREQRLTSWAALAALVLATGGIALSTLWFGRPS